MYGYALYALLIFWYYSLLCEKFYLSFALLFCNDKGPLFEEDFTALNGVYPPTTCLGAFDIPCPLVVYCIPLIFGVYSSYRVHKSNNVAFLSLSSGNSGKRGQIQKKFAPEAYYDSKDMDVGEYYRRAGPVPDFEDGLGDEVEGQDEGVRGGAGEGAEEEQQRDALLLPVIMNMLRSQLRPLRPRERPAPRSRLLSDTRDAPRSRLLSGVRDARQHRMARRELASLASTLETYINGGRFLPSNRYNARAARRGKRSVSSPSEQEMTPNQEIVTFHFKNHAKRLAKLLTRKRAFTRAEQNKPSLHSNLNGQTRPRRHLVENKGKEIPSKI